MKRAGVLLTLLGVVMLVFSAPMAEAALNKIRCTDAENCKGTNKGDLIIDYADTYTKMLGKDGNDTYRERSGGSDFADIMEDDSFTSNDTYLITQDNFSPKGRLWILDRGGNDDLLDFSAAGYSSPDCDPSPIDARKDGTDNDLLIYCGAEDKVVVFDYYTTNSIDDFKFTNGTFPGPSKSSSVSSTSTTQEQTAAELPDKTQVGDTSDPADSNASSEGWGQKG
jgi:hypothetical protein